MNKIEKNKLLFEKEKLKVEKKRIRNLKKELYIKIIILIILLILLFITSFNTGRKFYVLKNMYLEKNTGEVNSGIARWNFNAKIIIKNEL